MTRGHWGKDGCITTKPIQSLAFRSQKWSGKVGQSAQLVFDGRETDLEETEVRGGFTDEDLSGKGSDYLIDSIFAGAVSRQSQPGHANISMPVLTTWTSSPSGRSRRPVSGVNLRPYSRVDPAIPIVFNEL